MCWQLELIIMSSITLQSAVISVSVASSVSDHFQVFPVTSSLSSLCFSASTPHMSTQREPCSSSGQQHHILTGCKLRAEAGRSTTAGWELGAHTGSSHWCHWFPHTAGSHKEELQDLRIIRIQTFPGPCSGCSWDPLHVRGVFSASNIYTEAANYQDLAFLLISTNEGQHGLRIDTQTRGFWHFVNAAVITQGSLECLNGSIRRRRQSGSFMAQISCTFCALSLMNRPISN